MRGNSKTYLVEGTRLESLLVIVTVVYVILALLIPLDVFGNADALRRPIQSMFLASFVYFHGIRRYGRKNMRVWFATSFIISWIVEALSISISFPFGSYYYTDLLGMKIGPVPVIIMFAYFMVGYLAWTMSTIFLGNLGTGIEKRNLFLIPLIASFIMVMWNFCFEPIKSTIAGAWIWTTVGPYYGVPISNYFGWFFITFLTFQLYSLYLYKFSINESLEQSKTYWYLSPVMFLGLSLEYLLYPFLKTTNLEIYWSMFLSTIITMVFTSVLNIIFVKNLDEKYLMRKK